MQSQNTKQENTNNMTTCFESLTVNFNSYVGIKQTKQTKGDFIKYIHQQNSNSDQETTFT